MTAPERRRMDALLAVLRPALAAAHANDDLPLPVRIIVGQPGAGQATLVWNEQHQGMVLKSWDVEPEDRRTLAENRAADVVEAMRERSIDTDAPPTAVVVELRA